MEYAHICIHTHMSCCQTHAPKPVCFVTSQVASVWLTVAFTTDRYFMICHPFVSERCCSGRLARITIGATFFLALLYCLPRFFEHQSFVQPLPSADFFVNNYHQLGDVSSANYSQQLLLPSMRVVPNNNGSSDAEFLSYLHKLPKVSLGRQAQLQINSTFHRY